MNKYSEKLEELVGDNQEYQEIDILRSNIVEDFDDILDISETTKTRDSIFNETIDPPVIS